jgi:hypothetical protein
MKSSWLLLSVLIITGCSTALQTPLPANHFISPESSGTFLHGSVDTGIASGNELTVIPNAWESSSDLGSPSIDSNVDFALNFWLALIDGVDLQVVDQDLMSGLKWQFLGDAQPDAEEGNFSMAVSARYGVVTGTDNYSDPFLLGTPTASSNITKKTYDVQLIAGYRFSNILLLYGGPFYTHQTFYGSITTTPISGTGATTNLSGVFEQYGLDIGTEIGFNRFFMRPEASIAGASGLGVHATNPFFGFVAGLRW